MKILTEVYADINPAYPSRGAKRWAIFWRVTQGVAADRVPHFIRQYSSRRAAESAARKQNANREA